MVWAEGAVFPAIHVTVKEWLIERIPMEVMTEFVAGGGVGDHCAEPDGALGSAEWCIWKPRGMGADETGVWEQVCLLWPGRCAVDTRAHCATDGDGEE